MRDDERDLAACRATRMLVGLRGRIASAGGIHNARATTSPANTGALSHSRDGRGAAAAASVWSRPRSPGQPLWCCTPARAMAMTDEQRRWLFVLAAAVIGGAGAFLSLWRLEW
jgi:hypothetical protein